MDDEDYEELSRYNWQVHQRDNLCYAKRAVSRLEGNGIRQGNISMHRHLLRPGWRVPIDHIDGNGLNNQRHNLRITDAHTNAYNRGLPRTSSTGRKGVSLSNRKKNPYRASIKADGMVRYLGTFRTLDEAADAYSAAARELHGEFAHKSTKE